MTEFCLPQITKTQQPHLIFEYRRIYAKLRGAAYFVNDSETLFRTLIFDIVVHYNLYKTQLRSDVETQPGVDGLVT